MYNSIRFLVWSLSLLSSRVVCDTVKCIQPECKGCLIRYYFYQSPEGSTNLDVTAKWNEATRDKEKNIRLFANAYAAQYLLVVPPNGGRIIQKPENAAGVTFSVSMEDKGANLSIARLSIDDMYLCQFKGIAGLVPYLDASGKSHEFKVELSPTEINSIQLRDASSGSVLCEDGTGVMFGNSNGYAEEINAFVIIGQPTTISYILNDGRTVEQKIEKPNDGCLISRQTVKLKTPLRAPVEPTVNKLIFWIGSNVESYNKKTCYITVYNAEIKYTISTRNSQTWMNVSCAWGQSDKFERVSHIVSQGSVIANYMATSNELQRIDIRSSKGEIGVSMSHGKITKSVSWFSFPINECKKLPTVYCRIIYTEDVNSEVDLRVLRRKGKMASEGFVQLSHEGREICHVEKDILLVGHAVHPVIDSRVFHKDRKQNVCYVLNNVEITDVVESRVDNNCAGVYNTIDTGVLQLAYNSVNELKYWVGNNVGEAGKVSCSLTVKTVTMDFSMRHDGTQSAHANFVCKFNAAVEKSLRDSELAELATVDLSVIDNDGHRLEYTSNLRDYTSDTVYNEDKGVTEELTDRQLSYDETGRTISHVSVLLPMDMCKFNGATCKLSYNAEPAIQDKVDSIQADEIISVGLFANGSEICEHDSVATLFVPRHASGIAIGARAFYSVNGLKLFINVSNGDGVISKNLIKSVESCVVGDTIFPDILHLDNLTKHVVEYGIAANEGEYIIQKTCVVEIKSQ